MAILPSDVGNIQARHSGPLASQGFSVVLDLDISPVVVHLDGNEGAVDDGQQLWYNIEAPAKVGVAAPVTALLKELHQKMGTFPNS